MKVIVQTGYDLFTVPGGDGQWVMKVAVCRATLPCTEGSVSISNF